MAYPRIYAKRHSAGLLISVVFLLRYTGGNGLVVKASVGDDVVLPCTPVEPTTNTADQSVYWSRTNSPPNEYVHFRRHGKDEMTLQTSTYEGRTSLFQDEVKNLYLKLSSVQQSDEATYKCFLPESLQEVFVQLIVGNNETLQAPDNGSLDGHGDTRRGITGNESITETPSGGPHVRDAEVTSALVVLIIITALVVVVVVVIVDLVYKKKQSFLARSLSFLSRSIHKSSGHGGPRPENGDAVAERQSLNLVEAPSAHLNPAALNLNQNSPSQSAPMLSEDCPV